MENEAKIHTCYVASYFAQLINSKYSQAQWSAISSGYAVTTNFHGIDVPVGQPVWAIAGTTDSSITEIIFSWLDPDGNPVETEPVENTGFVTICPSDAPQEVKDWTAANDDATVWYASSELFAPSQVGDWTVKATFIGATGPQSARTPEQ
jgi:hypothetical protein